VKNSYATGNVTGSLDNVGGVVGWNEGGTVDNCYAIGSNITGTGSENTGGVVGLNASGTIQHCYATGFVSGNNNVGGVVGYSLLTGAAVRYCYATGDVIGTGGWVGGVVGSNAVVVENCYYTGNVLGNGSFQYTGGVVGGWGTVRNCYATGGVAGDQNVGGISGQVAKNNETPAPYVSENCVALNTSVTARQNNAAYVARIAAVSSPATLSNNYARTGMTIRYNTTTNKTALDVGLGNNIDGQDVAAGTYNTQGFWTGITWDFVNVWQWGANNLPILRNMPGNPSQNHVSP
jgi:hypothetical protein